MELSGVLMESYPDVSEEMVGKEETQARGSVPMSIPKLATSTLTKDTEAARHLCTDCGRWYSQARSLRNHMRRKHPASHERPRFTCNNCTKVFYETNEFQSHINMHAGMKPFACKTCDSKFANKRSLSRHVCTKSTKDTPVAWQCEVCGKEFRAKQRLRLHMLSHDSTPRYSCQWCKCQFKQRQSLKRHEAKRCKKGILL